MMNQTAYGGQNEISEVKTGKKNRLLLAEKTKKF